MESAATHPGDVWAPTSAVGEHRTVARRLAQALVLLPLFSLILLPEYVQGPGDPETKSVLYRFNLGPLRLVDALLLMLIAAHVMVWASSRSLRVKIPRPLVAPALGFAAAIMLGMAYGALHGGSDLFFDWRALALGSGLYIVFALWTQDERDAKSAMICFSAFMAVRVGIILAGFALGAGDMIFGMRIPVFDGPTLSAVACAGVLALCMGDGVRGWRAAIWTCLAGACCLLVLLSFRRTFWTELGLATLLLLIARRVHRGRKLLTAGAGVVVVALVLGPSFYERLRSLDFTQDETEFSQGNPDHVGEVLDAWEQAQRSPLMGIGLGTSFPTTRVQGWKDESVMVHNAPLHVWLKYGFLGLGCYLWFHAALFRTLWQRTKHCAATRTTLNVALQAAKAHKLPRNVDEPFALATFAFLAAQFVTTMGFAPWPYSSLQSATLAAFLLAIALKGSAKWNCRPSQ